MRIVVVDANLPAVRPELEAALPAGSEVRWHARHGPGVAADVEGAQVLVSSRLPASLAPACGALRLLQAPSAGTDGWDDAALAALPPGAQLANTGHHELSIAEHVLAAVVWLRRGMGPMDAALRRDRWASSTWDPSLTIPAGLAGARLGLVGYGAIGRAVHRAFDALGARARAVSGSGRPDRATPATGAGGAPVLEHLAPALPAASGLHPLLAGSDVVVLSAPLDERTRGMVGARELALLPPGAVLVNVGRGPLVDEDALHDALTTGRLGGAVLDVWWSYPPAAAPGEPVVGAPSRRRFGDVATTVLSPHSSGVTRQTFLARAADVAANAHRLLEGRALLSPVPRAVAGARG